MSEAFNMAVQHHPYSMPPIPRATAFEVACVICGKSCNGHGGLMQHEKTVHGVPHLGRHIDKLIMQDKELHL